MLKGVPLIIISLFASAGNHVRNINFEACGGPRSSKNQRIIRITPHYGFVRERRAEQKKEKCKKEMSVRAQIEETVSKATRFLGLRYAKYKGEAGHQLLFYLIGAALNTKRLIKAINNGVEFVQMAKA
jgi:hypothetical protein